MNSPMDKIRVLIVDDSAVIRKLVSQVLGEDPALEVSSTAPNGRIALAKIRHLHPDIITLDVDMPEMDGLTTLVEIRKLYPSLPVIMFSSMTEQGAQVTLEALSLGASDYVLKPVHAGSFENAVTYIRQELISKIKALCHKSKLVELPVTQPPAAKDGALEAARVEIVILGVSTGGPHALERLLTEFPANFPVPVLIVQHMPAVFTNFLAERLNTKTRIRVLEGKPGDVLKGEHAWIAAGNFHMVIEKKNAEAVIQTNQESPQNFCRPSVDVLFQSVAKLFGAHTLAVVLTGMGQDGLQGCKAIREAGGQIIVQDKASSVVWGMPGAVVKAGLADKIVPLDMLGYEIIARVSKYRAASHAAETKR